MPIRIRSTGFCALVALQEWPQEKAGLLRHLGEPRQDCNDGGSAAAALDNAVEEFLRFESSNQLGNRRALRACTVGGVSLPAGALLTLGIGAANRDPAQFADPDQLDLARAENRHLAFGFGIHQYAGLNLTPSRHAVTRCGRWPLSRSCPTSPGPGPSGSASAPA